MRAIDDLIDNHKTGRGTISPEDRLQFESEVYRWINGAGKASPNDTEQDELRQTIISFRIPMWPLRAFARSMIYDIYHDGFPTLQAFIGYAGGASVAPASVFVHLCGLTKKNGQYVSPVFDIKKAATPCAVFSYLVHIIRDFQKDHLRNLNYFPDDLIARYGMSRQQLHSMAQNGQITQGFRDMIRELYTVADQFRLKTYKMIQKIRPLVEPRYQLSLEIIFALYLMVFERIDIDNGTFSAEELDPAPEEIKGRVWQVISGFEAV